MVPYPKEALAQVVRGLRERKGLTQEELGRAAGYRAGAGVSISRLESGLLRPSPERFAGVARALGLTPEELEARAHERGVEDDAAGGAAGGHTAPAAAGRTDGAAGQRELNARKERIELEIGARTKAITERSEEFNAQHDRAQAAFLVRFGAIAERIEGAPRPDATQLRDDDTGGNPGAAAVDRRTSRAKGRAKAPAARARSGAKGAAVGTAVLAGIVALPMVGVFAGGLAWMRKRNRKQRQEFAGQLDEAEAELAATAPGIAALQDILRRAAETLDYIATHAGHALTRWDLQLGSGSLRWKSLGPDGQQRYLDFAAIAEAQVAIVTFDFAAILTARGPEQSALIEHADEVLTGSHDAVVARV